MEKKELYGIHVLPSMDDPLFEQRESELTHTSYLEEVRFFSFIQQGNTDMVKYMLANLTTSGVVVGRLSDDPVRQMQYLAVCQIAIGIRYAIQGGLDEMQAFSFSDKYIMHIDKLTTVDEIISYMGKTVIELTELVRENAHGDCPIQIRKCLNYIDKHLHEAIRLSDLVALANFSEDYLSKLFKKHIGKTLGKYIMEKKLEAAQAMLRGGYDPKQTAYNLGFCSQTYFITCFKKAYGITPNRYAVMCRGL